jgi:hypothetical protein
LPLPVTALLLALGGTPAVADTSHCAGAARFLREGRSMTAIVERDTIDDWRTGKLVPGCRVTAAGTTTLGVRAEAIRFYELLRAAGWARTPDPRDSPNEASMRFRREGSDCLFNVNAQALLMTDAEFTVTDAVTPKAGETRYHLFVMCTPAMAAAAR